MNHRRLKRIHDEYECGRTHLTMLMLSLFTAFCITTIGICFIAAVYNFFVS